jgi:hypothetical protein
MTPNELAEIPEGSWVIRQTDKLTFEIITNQKDKLIAILLGTISNQTSLASWRDGDDNAITPSYLQQGAILKHITFEGIFVISSVHDDSVLIIQTIEITPTDLGTHFKQYDNNHSK